MNDLYEGKFKRVVKPLGNTQILFTSEIFKRETLDTEVKIIGENNLCWIAGNTIEQFINELNAVINKYRI